MVCFLLLSILELIRNSIMLWERKYAKCIFLLAFEIDSLIMASYFGTFTSSPPLLWLICPKNARKNSCQQSKQYSRSTDKKQQSESVTTPLLLSISKRDWYQLVLTSTNITSPHLSDLMRNKDDFSWTWNVQLCSATTIGRMSWLTTSMSAGISACESFNSF